MKKSAIVFSIIVLALLAASPVFSYPPALNNAIDYLNSSQKQDGSWGNTVTSTNTEYLSTVAVLLPLNP